MAIGKLLHMGTNGFRAAGDNVLVPCHRGNSG
jgi:hypothetical protein